MHPDMMPSRLWNSKWNNLFFSVHKLLLLSTHSKNQSFGTFLHYNRISILNVSFRLIGIKTKCIEIKKVRIILWNQNLNKNFDLDMSSNIYCCTLLSIFFSSDVLLFHDEAIILLIDVSSEPVSTAARATVRDRQFPGCCPGTRRERTVPHNALLNIRKTRSDHQKKNVPL